ncbi:DedA family protein [Promicromonospora iranensis]|uniref:Membrane protein DedA with SNARE-associated domain n=1 Tax=Promicromonospora iranensis TaxID=1105144 RepID=A0ABU2CHV8_9MICO|nr:DedA family protein [Promicromonospora iranensis]MDR7380918.1 membrane protein DedA with SNARE-associated domain [Promicromonospora iranensis]
MTTHSFASTVADWAIGLMETLGAPGAGVAIALENLFPPLPSEVILPLAGFTASQGSLVLWHVLIWTTAGSVVGAVLLYALGAWLGRDRLRAIVDRMPLVPLEDVDKAEAWFNRHGDWAVLIGRLIPIVRSLISIPAGVERMPLGRFLAFTTLGSGFWNTLLVGAGYLLGDQWHVVEQSVGVFQRVVIVVVVLLVVWWLVKVLRGRRDQDTPRHVRER